jgi:hypothetical protein
MSWLAFLSRHSSFRTPSTDAACNHTISTKTRPMTRSNSARATLSVPGGRGCGENGMSSAQGRLLICRTP